MCIRDSNYPFLLEDEGEAFERGLSTFRFILDRLQLPSGWICGVYAKGVFYGDRFDYNQPGSVLLMRKDADLLLFLMKQAMLLREQGILQECYEEKLRRFCDAFVALFERYGQLGQFIDAETGEMLIGNTASGAIASAGLALAYEFFGDGRFLETARKLGVYYYDHYVSRGMLNGGPGDACQAPDSESAFGMLESYVQLYETTGEERWLACAEETFQQAVTWVMSYDFAFPAESFSAKRRIHTLGTILANAQNKHATPGICTLSGNSILKLYRFTGNSEYLSWMKAISHAIPQFVSLRERPVFTLEKKYLPSGWINERVQTCDWEGKQTVGEFLYGSNWPEVTMLLTYTEVPGIYADFSSGTAEAFDHIRCKVLERKEDEMLLELCNETMYDAVVTVLADDRLKRGLVKHSYFGRMKKSTCRLRAEKTCGCTDRTKRNVFYDQSRGWIC